MKYVTPTVELVEHDRDALNRLIYAKQTRLDLSPETLEEIRQWPIDRKYEEVKLIATSIPAPLEMVSVTFSIVGCSRAFTHQLVRNRLGSYAQQSQRVVSVRDAGFVLPDELIAEPTSTTGMQVVGEALAATERAYNALLDAGYKVETARALLPTNTATTIVARYNLRAFRDMVWKRIGGRVQREHRDVVDAMKLKLLLAYPWVRFLFENDTHQAVAELNRLIGELPIEGPAKQHLLRLIDQARGAQ